MSDGTAGNVTMPHNSQLDAFVGGAGVPAGPAGYERTVKG